RQFANLLWSQCTKADRQICCSWVLYWNRPRATHLIHMLNVAVQSEYDLREHSVLVSWAIYYHIKRQLQLFYVEQLKKQRDLKVEHLEKPSEQNGQHLNEVFLLYLELSG